MSNFDDFVKRMKVEKDGFEEMWESRRIIRELETVKVMKGVSQATIAERAGLHQSAISRFFSCKYDPQISLVVKIAKALGCKLCLEITDKQ